jgi:hypothetical protein
VKPRPTSLFVPKTDQPIEAPPMVRSVSAHRPPMNRAHSTDMHLPQTKEARAAFATGAFADPKMKKAGVFDIKAPLLTDAHVRLISSLRDECARLHGYARHLTNKVSDMNSTQMGIQLSLQDSRSTCAALREHNRRLLAANQSLVGDLKTATDSLAEVDAMFMNVSKKRMSRLSEASQIHSQDMLLHPDPPERPLSPTPNRAYGRSAVSLDVEH